MDRYNTSLIVWIPSCWFFIIYVVRREWLTWGVTLLFSDLWIMLGTQDQNIQQVSKPRTRLRWICKIIQNYLRSIEFVIILDCLSRWLWRVNSWPKGDWSILRMLVWFKFITTELECDGGRIFAQKRNRFQTCRMQAIKAQHKTDKRRQ